MSAARNIPLSPAPPDLPDVRTRRRLKGITIALMAAFAAVSVRLVQIQVLEAAAYREAARRQYEAKEVLPALRGNITDREGRVLASNTVSVTFAVDPEAPGFRAGRTAERFARFFRKSTAFYLKKIRSKAGRPRPAGSKQGAPGRKFIPLETRLSLERAEGFRTSDLPGVVREEHPLRLYHFNFLAGHVLGFTDGEARGRAGIELQYEDSLRGEDGYAFMQRDGRRRHLAAVDYPRKEPRHGRHVELTLDLHLQAIAEEELRTGVEQTGARGGTAVLLDPLTGEVLAMATHPRLNPNRVEDALHSSMRNRAVEDAFEPGSVFKLVTAAAALEHRVIRPEERFFAEHGLFTMVLPGGKKRPIRDTKKHGMLSFREAVEVSSNIVMAKASERIGSELLYTTARAFGFGTATGVGLPGEQGGELHKPALWSGSTLASMAFGYDVQVTPLQVAAAYAAVANGGNLLRPFIVRRVLAPDGTVIMENLPQVIRRVVSEETAAELRGFLRGVVERGTGTGAKVTGVSVAGKTGTARQAENGVYLDGAYTASFAGLLPADRPRLVILVVLDRPDQEYYSGGLAAAPVFRAIAAKALAASGRFAPDAPGPDPGAVA
ncbi:MAG: penicillin-binding protein 2, partial [Bacteroidota bacterium]